MLVCRYENIWETVGFMRYPYKGGGVSAVRALNLGSYDVYPSTVEATRERIVGGPKHYNFKSSRMFYIFTFYEI